MVLFIRLLSPQCRRGEETQGLPRYLKLPRVLFFDLYITLIYLYFNFIRIHYSVLPCILYFRYIHLIISLAIVYPMLLHKLLYIFKIKNIKIIIIIIIIIASKK